MMPRMDPYIERILGHLGDRDPMAVLAATPARLEAAVAAIGQDGLERPWAPGKWTSREVLCHLADCEVGIGFRLRQALAEDGGVAQPFDQDAWARRYGPLSADAALNAFRGLRAWNLALLRGVGAADLERTYTHPERGEETVRMLRDFLAGHDLNHLGQLERAAGAR
jgi:hypothetical protein